ncbi:MAG: GDSL-type esterase/lipase family protein [Methylobacter sp.]
MNNAQGKTNNSRFRTTLTVLFVGVTCYFWGVLTYYKQIFPFEQIRGIKNVLLGGSFVDPLEPKWRNTIFQAFSPQASVVMIGDSITEGGEWREIFPQINIANRGIAGDKTGDILRRMEPIFAVNAKKAFIMVGINDIYQGRSVETTFANYTNIVQQLKSKGISVYIQSTLECSASKCGGTLNKIRLLNDKLKAYAAQQKLTYININEGLTSEKYGLLKDYTYDGVHLLGSGYLKWSKTIAPYVDSN